MKRTFIFGLVIALGIVTSVIVFALPSGNDTAVATLDGTVITRAEIVTYVDNVLSDSYRAKLDTREGLHELAGHYIDRQLLLERAMKTIDVDDSMLKTHTEGTASTELAYLSALIKKEINDQIRIHPDEVDAYMHKHGIEDRQSAEIQMMPDVRARMMRELINEVRTGHRIEFL